MPHKPAYFPFKSEHGREAYLRAYNHMLSLWPVSYKPSTIETSYGPTHVNIAGPKDAPPLVLMHGMQASSGMWVQNIKALASQYRVYAVDTIGDFGQSIMHKHVNNIDGYVTWMLELLDGLQLQQPRFMGMSYGGWLSTNFALQHPERVKALVLIAPAATFKSLSLSFLIRGTLMLLPFRMFTASMYNWSAIPESEKTDAYRATMEGLIEQAWMGRLHFRTQRFIPPTTLKDEQLQSIKVPLLLLVGEQEKLYNPHDVTQRAIQLVPNAEADVIPNASHDLIVAQADHVNETALEFFAAP